MAKNGPSDMYTVKPLYEANYPMETPTCMYKVQSIYSGEPTSENQDGCDWDEVIKRQEEILNKLENLKSRVLSFKKECNITDGAVTVEDVDKEPPKYRDIVIKADPQYPPYSIWALHHLLSKDWNVRLVTFVHSTLVDVPISLQSLSSKDCQSPVDLTLSVIWKNVGKDPEMMVDPLCQGMISGEVNIVRYICRLMDPKFDEDALRANLVDNWLEMAYTAILHGSAKDRNNALKVVNGHLGKNEFLVNNEVSMTDIVLWSTLRHCPNQTLPANVSKWCNKLNDISMFQVPVL